MIHMDYDTCQNYILIMSIKELIDTNPSCFVDSIITIEKIVSAIRTCGPFKKLAVEDIHRICREHDSYVDDETASAIFDIVMKG